jgi:hypothetical protein
MERETELILPSARLLKSCKIARLMVFDERCFGSVACSEDRLTLERTVFQGSRLPAKPPSVHCRRPAPEACQLSSAGASLFCSSRTLFGLATVPSSTITNPSVPKGIILRPSLDCWPFWDESNFPFPGVAQAKQFRSCS